MVNWLDIFISKLKNNKKLTYLFFLLIVLILFMLVLKFDFSNNKNVTTIKHNLGNNKININDEYTDGLEEKINRIIGKIKGVKNVDCMIYTKSSCKLEPIYDENVNTESSKDITTSGIKRESEKNNTQRQVKVNSNNEALKKYSEYPKISGVLIVIEYSGSQNIRSILIKSIQTLLDIDLNDIEIIVSSCKGVYN